MADKKVVFVAFAIEDARIGNPPILSGGQKWSYAVIANFCIGVMPPSAIWGRSLL